LGLPLVSAAPISAGASPPSVALDIEVSLMGSGLVSAALPASPTEAMPGTSGEAS
jgi:hypothetical protein